MSERETVHCFWKHIELELEGDIWLPVRTRLAQVGGLKYSALKRASLFNAALCERQR
jgi:hypothetical protein